MLDSKRPFKISYKIVNDFQLLSVRDQGHIIQGVDNHRRQLCEALERDGIGEGHQPTEAILGSFSPYQ